jgi:hypothetical protein
MFEGILNWFRSGKPRLNRIFIKDIAFWPDQLDIPENRTMVLWLVWM